MSGNMTQSELVFALPPSPIIREFAENLDTGVGRTVLDAGCGKGRNALHLAQAGHNVLGINSELEDLRAASTLLTNLGNIAGCCNFVAADVRALPVNSPFDIVLSNEVLHCMAKTDSRHVLDTLRGLTRQGGVNVVSGYVVRPGTANATNTARCFAPNELRDSYQNAGWHVTQYNENYLNNQYVGLGGNRKEIISSLARIIAVRPWQ